MKDNVYRVNIENEEEYIKWCRSLKSEFKGNPYNELINRHSSEIEKRKAKEKEKYKEYLPFSVQYKLKYERYPTKSAVLNIDVSDKQRNRAYIFMNCFMEAVQALGGYVSVDQLNGDNTVIRFPHCTFECSLVEKRGKYRDIKPEGITTMRPSYDTIDTGKLIFKIYILNKDGKQQNEIIYDEEHLPLKDQITDIFINIRPVLIEISQRNIEAERILEEKYEERKLQWEKEEEEKEREKQYEIREKQQKIIMQHIEKWKHIEHIKDYVADIRYYAEQQSDTIKEPMEQYCDYVMELFNKNELYSDILKFTEENKVH